jgi:hypothetical protein
MIIGVSKRKAGEETGWKPVCRDRRGRLSSQCLACQNGRQAKKQAGSLFAGTGEDACLPNDDHYESWLMAEMSAAMILPFRTIAQPDRSSRAACSNASAVT